MITKTETRRDSAGNEIVEQKSKPTFEERLSDAKNKAKAHNNRKIERHRKTRHSNKSERHKKERD